MNEKSKISDLAIFGGTPTFKEKLHVGRPNIGNRKNLIKNINTVLDNHWLTNDGPFVLALEKKIADFIDTKHCFLICNATIGLEIAIRALNLTGEVIVPSMTFIATAHALEWQKIKPVFCDIDPKTWNIDPKKIEKLITPKTTAIIGVHLFGRPCNIEELEKIAKKYKLKLLFDSAHAFGCSHKGKMIGNFGNTEIFSFHATKFFNSLEGGAIVTNDDALAENIRLMRNFGFDNHNVLSIGTNGKMNEFSAAMGLTSFRSIDNFIKKNRGNYKTYKKYFEKIQGIELINYNEKERCNFQYLVLKIDSKITKINRDDLLKILWKENVFARNYFYPGCHKAQPYASRKKHFKLDLINTEKISQQLLSLPTGTSMDDVKIKKLCKIIKFCLKNGDEISKKLKNK